MPTIIEKITESEDKGRPREEWSWLVEPLAKALILQVKADPGKLYVNSQLKDSQYHLSKLDSRSLLHKTLKWQSMTNAILENEVSPYVLLGDIGVGKTSLLHGYLYYLKEKESIVRIYYNHNTERGRGDNRHLKEDIRLNNRLHTYLLQSLKKQCSDYGLTGLDIFKYEEDDFAADPQKITFSSIEALKEAAGILYEKKGLSFFYIIDNIDEYPRELQETAVGFADFCSQFKGIHGIVCLRPETFHRTQMRLHGMQRFPVYPPHLKPVLLGRLEYLWDNGGGETIRELTERMEEIGLTLKLSWTKKLSDKEKLKDTHHKILGQIIKQDVLIEALMKLHNFNVREILEIIHQLLDSEFFSERMIEIMTKGKRNAYSARQEAMITTYLRGPYRRYRGRTSDYRVKNLNIINIPGVKLLDSLVGIRILQYIWKFAPDELSTETIFNSLTQYGYSKNSIKTALTFLAHNEYIRDVFRQKPWATETPSLEQDDVFTIHPAGVYLLGTLITRYAFRYCEAMADVMSHPNPYKIRWDSDKTPPALLSNAYGVLTLFIDCLVNEAKRVKQKDKANPSERILEEFMSDFYSSDTPAKDFIVNMAQDCKMRAGYLIKHGFRRAANYQLQCQNYGGKFETLCRKARQSIEIDTLIK